MMGTRAIIRVSGKPKFATHWDGSPEELGANLIAGLSMGKNLHEIAAMHTIDKTDPNSNNYTDYAEYDYDIRKGKVYYKPITYRWNDMPHGGNTGFFSKYKEAGKEVLIGRIMKPSKYVIEVYKPGEKQPYNIIRANSKKDLDEAKRYYKHYRTVVKRRKSP